MGYPGHAPKPVGRIYANGQWIGGEPREREQAPAPAAPAEAETQPEPQDVRWDAAKVLLADLRASADVRACEAADRIEGGLRDVLGRLDRLAAARAAHRALGGDDAKVDAARARVDAQAHDVLDALRDFHLVALAGGPAPSLDRVEDLLARVAADAEVDDVASRRTRAAAARAARQG